MGLASARLLLEQIGDGLTDLLDLEGLEAEVVLELLVGELFACACVCVGDPFGQDREKKGTGLPR